MNDKRNTTLFGLLFLSYSRETAKCSPNKLVKGFVIVKLRCKITSKITNFRIFLNYACIVT